MTHRKATLLALSFLLSLVSASQALALVNPSPFLVAKNASALVAHAAGQNLDVSNYTTLNEVENNYLSHTEAKRLKQLERELFDCNFAGNDCNAIVAEKTALEALDRQRDKDLRDACSSKGSAAACARERDKALEAFASYGDPQGIGSDVDGHKRHVELILASTDKAQAILATAVLGPVAGAAIVSAGTAAVQACLLNPAGCIGILEAAAAEFTGGVAVGVLAKKAATRAASQAGKVVTKKLLPDATRELAESNIRNTGKTVLGPYNPIEVRYINKAEIKDASYFDIGKAWDDLTPAERWAANQHFLDKIADAGDQVFLSISKEKIQPGTYLADEIEYLTKPTHEGGRGYKWVNQWSLVPRN